MAVHTTHKRAVADALVFRGLVLEKMTKMVPHI